MQFKKATKENLKLRLALSGASGSGKTFSALSIASNLGNRIAVIDTERGSASKYADLFNFDTCELTNYHPAKYIEAIQSAEGMGYEIIIIDSLSHAWFSELELAGGRFDGCAKVLPLERKLIDAMIGSKCHIIATMRSKTEWLIEENQKNGKTSYSPKKVGTSPIQASGIEFEFDVAGELDYTHILTISKSRCPAITDKTYLNPGKEFASELKAWLATSQEFQAFADKSFETQLPVQQDVPNQDLRVKQIRTLLNYPVELVVEWLKFQEVERPNQLQSHQIDELVKTMCLSWGQDKFEHPNHATNSYHECVVESVADGMDEVAAIRAWMQSVQQSEQRQSELKAV